jgi:uncharacterized RDD family membrane protein YckC
MSEATVFCNQCGQAVNAAASFCTRCGGTLSPSAMPGMMATPAGASPYSGFWIRFVAHLIDSAVINIVLAPVAIVLFSGYFATHHFEQNQPPDAGFFVLIGLFMIIVGLAVWLYEALMTSSSKQGTLGKMAFRIKVTDLNGARISFGRATGRFFAKMVSSMIFTIGFLMAAFTERKQALHDMIAGTLVMRG